MKPSFFISFLLGALLYGTAFSSSSFLARFPDVHQDAVVFVAGGDIWSVSTQGGAAVRLTMHDGDESFPKFSPDGSLIAFTGEYDGNADVYVMNRFGGDIRRVTFHPDYDEVVGWHEGKNKIIFRSSRFSATRSSQLYLINADGSGLEQVPLPQAVQGCFSPDGTKIAYNKVARENRTWKRYKGGLAQEIHVYDFTRKSERNITNFRGTDRIPMWIKDKIYFSSDRDGVLNIWCYDTNTDAIEQITRHKTYDVRRPSMGGGQIVYEVGGDLYLLDVGSKQSKKIALEILSDAPETRPYLKNLNEQVTGIACSPDGQKALLTARGEIFTLPRKEGITRNLTKSSGARDKDAVWSPDGKTIAWFSDQDGEYNLYLAAADGETPAQKITDFKNGYRHSLRWSPDNKKLAYTDQTLTLYFIDILSKKITKVDKAEFENMDISLDLKDIYDFSWSPDSRFLAYAKMDESWVNKLYIHNLETGRSQCISDGAFNDFHPVFTPDGEHLLFVSNRRFDPTFCDFEWEMVFKNSAGIYSYTLRKEGLALLPILPLKDEGDPEAAAQKMEKSGPLVIRIDFDGLNQRIEALPLPRGNYRHLSADHEQVYYLNKETGDFNRFEFRERGPMNLCVFNFKDKKASKIIEDIHTYCLSTDGKTIIYKKDLEVGLLEASARDSKGEAVSLAGLKMMLEPRKEWRQIFNESWRFERDFYYQPNMHGLDWPAMKIKYGKMLERAMCRSDVQFVIGELIGELNTSHTYVYGGDQKRKAESINTGLLGADYSVDEVTQLYRFAKIYRHQDWNNETMAPLLGPGQQIREGDYLLKVNGELVSAKRNIYSYFVDLAGKPTELVVNDKPSQTGARTVVVQPISSERGLRYIDWVERNREYVAAASNGQLGYMHLPDTYTGSAALFPRYYYAQTNKAGIIVDGRFNGGGLDPDIFLQRLDKKPLSYWTRRHSHDQATPWFSNQAHLVCLTNREAGSGGDELPYLFRLKGMGPVIGTRTWGGLVGVSMFISMIDGGGLTAPDYRIYNGEGKWVVENEGVTPDIEIDLDPADYGSGRDAQLDKAIEVLMKKIKEEPRIWPVHEPFPVDDGKM